MQKKEKRCRIAVGICVILVLALYVAFWLQPELLYMVKKGAFSLRRKRVTVTTAALLLGLYGCLMKRYDSEKKEKIRLWIMYAVTPIVVLFFVEFANIAGPGLLWRKICFSTIYRTGISLVLLWIIQFFLTAITGSLKFSSIFLSVFLGGFSLACQYVYKFRGVPLLASDLISVGTAMDVMGNYDYSLRFHDLIMLLGLLAWCVCLFRTKGKKLFHGKKYIVIAVLYSAFFAAACWGWVNTSITERLNLKINTYLPIKGYKKSGTFLNFMTSFHVMAVKKPEGYSIEAADAIAEPYRQEADAQDAGNTPNLIIVMDEAFSDLQSIWDFETSEDIMPFYHSLKENAVKGNLYVPYFGAQTANSEFEVLTGLTKAFLPAGATPYQLYVNSELPCLNTALKKTENYQGILAMHPYYAKGYNRESAYASMGFSDFISIEDMEYTQDDLVRRFISDKKDVEMIIEEYERAKEESSDPFYMFNVTMQNHSGYEIKYDNLEENITIEEKYDDPQASLYINLIKKSDEALESLISYFSEVEEPTVVVFYGDHQPSVSATFYENIMGKNLADLSSEECMDRYRTPFLIWANYDIPEAEDVMASTNYLSMLIKQYAGMEMTAFDCFLQDLYEEIPVLSVNGFYDKEGVYYEVGTKETPYDEALNQYWILEYNTLFDSKNRIEKFFDE